jgi:hypothetical protein
MSSRDSAALRAPGSMLRRPACERDAIVDFRLDDTAGVGPNHDCAGVTRTAWRFT